MIRDFRAIGGYYETGDSNTVEGVVCDVSHCYYNRDGRVCVAGQIKVGPQNAVTTDDTVCATFRPE